MPGPKPPQRHAATTMVQTSLAVRLGRLIRLVSVKLPLVSGPHSIRSTEREKWWNLKLSLIGAWHNVPAGTPGTQAALHSKTRILQTVKYKALTLHPTQER
ncbi:unnamed protein product, partial [Ectocarpus sp. 6 AP-2014]